MIEEKDLTGIDGLTEDQIRQIVGISNAATKTQINQLTGQIHRQYEDDFFEATGMRKPGDWVSSKGTTKTYEWLKESALPELMSKTRKVQDQAGEIDQLKKDFHKTLQAERANYLRMALDNSLDSALVGQKFRPEYNEDIIKTLVKAAKTEIESEYTSELVEGKVKLKKEGSFDYFDPKDLVLDKLKPVLAKPRVQLGAGTKGGQTITSHSVNISGARTQEEALQKIHDYAFTLGHARGTEPFQQVVDQAYKDLNVSSLPTKV